MLLIGCGECKIEFVSKFNDLCEELREKKKELLNNLHPLDSILAEGCQRSRKRVFAARDTVREKMKFTGGGIL